MGSVKMVKHVFHIAVTHLPTCQSVRKYSKYEGCSENQPQRLVPSDGYNMLTCETDSDCDAYQLCINCVCAATCQLGCAKGQVCFAGICMEACGSSLMCTSSQDICLGGICRDFCQNDEIYPHGTDKHWKYGECSNDVITPECNSGSCPPEYVCEGGLCEKLCNDDSDCGFWHRCGLGICSVPCMNGEPQCVNGIEMSKCYSDLDCGDERVCRLGICSTKCSCSSSGCDDAVCDVSNGYYCSNITLSCVHPTRLSNPDLETNNIGQNCTEDSDCGHYSLYCNQASGSCLPLSTPPGIVRCDSSNYHLCGINGECKNGKCDCIRDGTGQCINSIPTPCIDTFDCDGCLECNANFNRCTCPQDTVLIGSNCISIFPEDEEGGVYFTACEDNSDCRYDSFCLSGNCYPVCDEYGCAQYPSMQCASGVCMPDCNDDTDCDSNQFCSTIKRVCVARCKAKKDCPPGLTCLNGQCAELCSQDGNCRDGNACDGDTRLVQKSVHRDSVLVNAFTLQTVVAKKHAKMESAYTGPRINLCRDVCFSTKDCAPQLSCIEGICSGSCSDEFECGDGFKCSSGFCVISCDPIGELNSLCPSHQRCYEDEGYCQERIAEPCDSSADCQENEYCSGLICVNAVRAGALCSNAFDCGKIYKY
ncbi:protein draper-like [Watersipora subatra]|uniref:protein draper-like n=1 Tax=Watersipora subatra TaxID=2589382 RepID=UPI00355BCA8D